MGLREVREILGVMAQEDQEGRVALGAQPLFGNLQLRVVVDIIQVAAGFRAATEAREGQPIPAAGLRVVPEIRGPQEPAAMRHLVWGRILPGVPTEMGETAALGETAGIRVRTADAEQHIMAAGLFLAALPTPDPAAREASLVEVAARTAVEAAEVAAARGLATPVAQVRRVGPEAILVAARVERVVLPAAEVALLAAAEVAEGGVPVALPRVAEEVVVGAEMQETRETRETPGLPHPPQLQ